MCGKRPEKFQATLFLYFYLDTMGASFTHAFQPTFFSKFSSSRNSFATVSEHSANEIRHDKIGRFWSE